MKANLGIDDGSSGIKIYDGINCFKIASMGRSGMSSRSAIGHGRATEYTYRNSEGDIYTVGELVSTHEATDYPGYQTSKLNAALVQHALLSAGYSNGQELAATFSLPFNHFYRSNGEKNERLIAAKRAHVCSNDFKRSGGEQVTFNKEKTGILAEGLAAAMDRYIEIKDGEVSENAEAINMQMGVVDIGGNTLDLCVVERMDVLHEHSTSTQSSGVIAVIDNTIKLLESHPTTSKYFDGEVPYFAVKQALGNGGRFKMGAKEINVTPQIKEAKSVVANQIKATLTKRFGSGFAMEEIIFVGGGSELLKKELLQLFEGARIDKEPEFANAKGLYKYSAAFT